MSAAYIMANQVYNDITERHLWLPKRSSGGDYLPETLYFLAARQVHEDEQPKVNSKPEVVGNTPPKQAGLELPVELLGCETSAAGFPGGDGQPV